MNYSKVLSDTEKEARFYKRVILTFKSTNNQLLMMIIEKKKMLFKFMREMKVMIY